MATMEKKGCGVKSIKKEAKEIVDRVEGYTKEDKAKRRKEVEAAFGEKKPKTDAKK